MTFNDFRDKTIKIFEVASKKGHTVPLVSFSPCLRLFIRLRISFVISVISVTFAAFA